MRKLTPEHTNPHPVANLGDVNYLEHGGRLLFVDGEHCWAEIVEPPECVLQGEDATDADRWRVFVFDVEKPILLRDDRLRPMLVDAVWTPELGKPESHEEWYSSELVQVGRCCGTTAEDLAQRITSKDPVGRLSAYCDIGQLYGWINLDHDPLMLTQHEAYARYNELDDCPCWRCSLSQRGAEAEALDGYILVRERQTPPTQEWVDAQLARLGLDGEYDDPLVVSDDGQHYSWGYADPHYGSARSLWALEALSLQREDETDHEFYCRAVLQVASYDDGSTLWQQAQTAFTEETQS